MARPGQFLRLEEAVESHPAVVVAVGEPDGLARQVHALLVEEAEDPEGATARDDHLLPRAVDLEAAVKGKTYDDFRDTLLARGSLTARTDISWGETSVGVRSPALIVLLSAGDLEESTALVPTLCAQLPRWFEICVVVHDWPATTRHDVGEGAQAKELAARFAVPGSARMQLMLMDVQRGRIGADAALEAWILDRQQRPVLERLEGVRVEPAPDAPGVWRAWLHGAALDREAIIRSESEPMLNQAIKQYVLRGGPFRPAPPTRGADELLGRLARSGNEALRLHGAAPNEGDPEFGRDGPALKVGERQVQVMVNLDPQLGKRPKGVRPLLLEEYLNSLQSAWLAGRLSRWTAGMRHGVKSYVQEARRDIREDIERGVESTLDIQGVRAGLAGVPRQWAQRLTTELFPGTLPSFGAAMSKLREAVGSIPERWSVLVRALLLLAPLGLVIQAAVREQRWGVTVGAGVLAALVLFWAFYWAAHAAKVRIAEAYEGARTALRAQTKREAMEEVGSCFAEASAGITRDVRQLSEALDRVSKELAEHAAEQTEVAVAPGVAPDSAIGRISSWRREHPARLFESEWEADAGGLRALKGTDPLRAAIASGLRPAVVRSAKGAADTRSVAELRDALVGFVSARVGNIRLWRAYATLGADKPDEELFRRRFGPTVPSYAEMQKRVDRDVRLALTVQAQRRRPFVAPEILRRWQPDPDVDAGHRALGEWCYVVQTVRLAAWDEHGGQA